jgi:alpha-galactosidase
LLIGRHSFAVESWQAMIDAAPCTAIGADGQPLSAIEVKRSWQGAYLETSITNRTDRPVAVQKVVLFDVAHGWKPTTPFYGEGFTMLSQTAGTIGAMVDLDGLTDRGHYRLPEPEGYRVVYGMMTASPESEHVILGFTSCRRFVGSFEVNNERLRVVVDTEGLTLPPNTTWALEEMFVATSPDRSQLLRKLAERIIKHHPRLTHPKLPTGWCSWYWHGPLVTPRDIEAALTFCHEHGLEMDYIQIDDGYQPWMGDWLKPNQRFKGKLQTMLREIREAGNQPAIWVAPFVASPKSELFQSHPDWFVKDADGQPLRSDTISFGGWRLGPWYMLDGTHPEAQQYLEKTFRTMREEWGCTYFKLDANAWGCLPGGRHHDPLATRVEAYRRGMAAIRRGAGDAFLLGCNHPIWPSLGEIHGSRSSMDITRDWNSFKQIARENLSRNWQNNILWWNDPDCIVLADRGRDLPENEFLFHATATYATGGMMLSGDKLDRIPAERLPLLRTLLANPGTAAEFTDDSMQVGYIPDAEGKRIVLLNWGDEPIRLVAGLEKSATVTDVWTKEDLGRQEQHLEIELPARSGRLLDARWEAPGM